MRKGYVQISDRRICAPEDYGTVDAPLKAFYYLVQNQRTGVYRLWNDAIDEYEKCDQEWARKFHGGQLGRINRQKKLFAQCDVYKKRKLEDK